MRFPITPNSNAVKIIHKEVNFFLCLIGKSFDNGVNVIVILNAKPL